MDYEVSSQLPGPRGGEWDNADAMLGAWIDTLNANAGIITAKITRHTKRAAAAVTAIETTATGLTAAQLSQIQRTVDTIVASDEYRSWLRANLRARECLQGYPTLQRLLTYERILGLQDRFGWGVQAAVSAAVAQGVLPEDEQAHIDLLTRPWRTAGLPIPDAPQRVDIY